MKPVSVAIMAGGKSSRFGSDKALARLDPTGPTLLERTARIGQQLSDDVFVVAPADHEYGPYELRTVDDQFPGQGPAGGVITALTVAAYPDCLVLGCDYPLLSLPLLRWIIEMRAQARVVVPEIPGMSRQSRQGVLEVLQARYPRAQLAEIERAFACGERQLATIVGALEPVRLQIGDIVRFDPGLRSFLNVNRPSDLERARRLLEERSDAFADR